MEELSGQWILGIVAAYFLVLIVIPYFTGRDAKDNDFFLADRQSPWYLVAFGMIGASLSGVTFISIPGKVGGVGQNMDFSYMQVVMGYLLGYAVIAGLLLPLYYRLQLTSVYTFLEQRFGPNSYRAGAGAFLISRTIGASFRLYLVAVTFQTVSVMSGMDIPFWMTVAITILLIWLYTFRGGIKTIVWTDSLQTFFMLAAAVLTVYAIGSEMGRTIPEIATMVAESEYAQIFFFEKGWGDPNNFFKQFVSGALIAIVMTGLDQDMMQKNLSCKNLKEAQWNMMSFSVVLFFVNLLFLGLGALLYLYAANIGLEIPERTDLLYPIIALQHLPPAAGIVFILGLIAAAYSSADSALTALTTSFCIDFLGFETEPEEQSVVERQKKTRIKVHIAFSTLLFLIIIGFNSLSNDAVITKLFIAAGYTYGPLLGLFAFGLISRRNVRDHLVLAVCIIAPVLSYVLNAYDLFIGFKLGFLILLLNGLLTYLGLWLISYEEEDNLEESPF